MTLAQHTIPCKKYNIIMQYELLDTLYIHTATTWSRALTSHIQYPIHNSNVHCGQDSHNDNGCQGGLWNVVEVGAKQSNCQQNHSAWESNKDFFLTLHKYVFCSTISVYLWWSLQPGYKHRSGRSLQSCTAPGIREAYEVYSTHSALYKFQTMYLEKLPVMG